MEHFAVIYEDYPIIERSDLRHRWLVFFGWIRVLLTMKQTRVLL